MSSENEQQPYWYSAQYQGGAVNFGYIEYQGTLVASLGGRLVFTDGSWSDPVFYPAETTVQFSAWGTDGSRLTITSFIPILETNQLILAFSTAVDLHTPLPLDSLLPGDSSYREILGPPPPETTEYNFLGLSPTEPPDYPKASPSRTGEG
jgi:hypothetical protein